jgi:hypothetical protein
LNQNELYLFTQPNGCLKETLFITPVAFLFTRAWLMINLAADLECSLL